VGLYLLSSSVGWKAGDLAASEASLAFPFRLGSASIFRLRREFSCRSTPSHQRCASSYLPALVASSLGRLGWWPGQG